MLFIWVDLNVVHCFSDHVLRLDFQVCCEELLTWSHYSHTHTHTRTYPEGVLLTAASVVFIQLRPLPPFFFLCTPFLILSLLIPSLPLATVFLEPLHAATCDSEHTGGIGGLKWYLTWSDSICLMSFMFPPVRVPLCTSLACVLLSSASSCLCSEESMRWVWVGLIRFHCFPCCPVNISLFHWWF